MTLTSALQHLRKNGKTSDFDLQGFPRLGILRNLVTMLNFSTRFFGVQRSPWDESADDSCLCH